MPDEHCGLTEAGADAPDAPGVYFFLAPDRLLLYVGTAGSLRRRLRQHAQHARKPRDATASALYPRVAEVGWTEHDDKDAAAAREADLIVALQPAFNKAYMDQGRWVYICTRDADPTRFALCAEPEAAPARTYGCFPHLGRGVGSALAIACSDGYAALLRALWAADAAPGKQYPRRLTSPSPPDVCDIVVAPPLRAPVHAFLSGRSARLLEDLADRHRALDPYMQPALTRDRVAAEAFFTAGPRRLRELRRRHDRRAGPVPRAVIEELLFTETCAEIGEFRRPDPDAEARAALGRRALSVRWRA